MTDNHLDTSYKLHIQSLRAFSVLLVFFYHLKIDFFENGYLGVDVFFVISGYVITQSIYSDYLKNKRVDLKNFYLKRLKRILPNLVFILSVTYLFYLIFGPPEISLWNDYLSSIFGISNFYYLYSDKGYFYNIFDNPFAHSWSLGVEEQFYLIYPFLIFIFFKVYKNKKFFELSLIILILISFASSFIFFKKYPDISFYFSPLRFWELGVGCLFFFINSKILKKRYVANIFLISLFMIIFTNVIQNMILKNLLSVLTAGLFIVSYKKVKFIENFFFQYLGKISYSFYLWHLPIIFFLNIYLSNDVYIIFFSLILTFFFSIFTFNYIESFFINSKKIYTSKIILPLILILSFSFSFLVYLKYFDQDLKYKVREKIYNINFLEKNYNWKSKAIFQNIFIGKNEIHKYCNESSDINSRNEADLIINCLKEKNRDYLFFMIGNSHTAQYVNTFNAIKEVKNLYFESTNEKMLPEKKLNKLKKYYKKIIYVTDINDINKLNLFIKSNLRNSKNIEFIFFNSTPFLHNIEKPLYCISKQIDCYSSKKIDYKKRDLKTLNNKLLELEKKYKNIHIFDSYNTLCPKEKCMVYNKEKNMLIFMDKTHLSVDGSSVLVKSLKSFLNKKINIDEL